jgi:hypothetical protein
MSTARTGRVLVVDPTVAGTLIGAIAGVGGSVAGGLVSVRLAVHARRTQRHQWLRDQRLAVYREAITAIESTVHDKTVGPIVAATAKLSLLEALSEEDVREASRLLRRRLGGAASAGDEEASLAEPLSVHVSALNSAMNRQFLS